MLLRIRNWFAGARLRGKNRCGVYVLLRQLNSGKLADIYFARCSNSNRVVVVKTLPKLRMNEFNNARFRRESELLARCSHPNVVEYLAAGVRADGSPYLAMEYIRGANLLELVNQLGGLPDGRAIEILRQLAQFLDALHAEGIVHADLAPRNVMLTDRSGSSDFVKVLDFGTAREWLAESLKGQVNQPISGTPVCMSPEACRSADSITPLSDIYSLGCLAFFLISGTFPFSGATPVEICWKQIHAEPPLMQLRSESVSAELTELIAKCLAKNAAQRPKSMKDVAEALLNCQPSTPRIA